MSSSEQNDQVEASVSNDRDAKIVLNSVSWKGFISRYGFCVGLVTQGFLIQQMTVD